MKPWVTFVMGGVIVGGTVFLLTRNEAQPQLTTPPAVAEPVTPPVAGLADAAPAASAPADASDRTEKASPVASSPRGFRRTEEPVNRSAAKAAAGGGSSSKSNKEPVKKAEAGTPAVPVFLPPAGSAPLPSTPVPGPVSNSDGPRPAPAPVVRDEAPKPPPRQPETVTIPAGTVVSVRLNERVASDTMSNGDTFRASLDQPLVVNGIVLAERGAQAQGRVVSTDPGGRVKGRAEVVLRLDTLMTSDGQRINLNTDNFTQAAQSNRKGDVAKVGVGAAIGAAIGAIAGGGKGAAIGAATGGAAGTGAVLTTRGSAAVLAPETRISFRLSQPVTVTEKID